MTSSLPAWTRCVGICTAFDRALANITRDVSDGCDASRRGARPLAVVARESGHASSNTEWPPYRDKISGIFRAKVDTSTVEEAIEDNLQTLIAAEGEAANAHVRGREPRNCPVPHRGCHAPQRRRAQAGCRPARPAVAQTSLIALIRNEGESKRLAARAMAFSVNAIGVALIIVVFASTGGLVGGEITRWLAVGRSPAQRLLEAVFGTAPFATHGQGGQAQS